MEKKPPHDEHSPETFMVDEEIPGQYHDDIASKDGSIIGITDIPPPEFQADDVEIENPTSKVASPPAKNILIIGIILLASIIFLYKLVFKESEQEIADKKRKAEIASQPITAAKPATKQDGAPKVSIGVVETPELPVADDNITSLPSLPAVPEVPATVVQTGTQNQQPAQNKKMDFPAPYPTLEAAKTDDQNKPASPATTTPPTAGTPAATPTPTTAALPEASANNVKLEGVPAPIGPTPEQIQEQIRLKEIAKRKTSMLVMNGGGTPKELIDGINDPNAIKESSATTVKASKVKDLSLMVLQGKMIEAVLETTINTDLPGDLRAIISGDVYAEAGRSILIPRGSRLIGSYTNGIQPGQQRLLITWGRVIRPDGVDIDISSPGTDQLGRSGMSGILDNKYKELITNSLLTTALSVGGAIALSSTQKAQTVTSSTTTGTAATGGASTSTQSGTPADAAILQGVQSLTDVGKTIAKGESTTPTIIINQGARVLVYVNKDLLFPASVVNKTNSTNN